VEAFTLHDNVSENELKCRSKICKPNTDRKNIFAVTFSDDQKFFSLRCQTCGAVIALVVTNAVNNNRFHL
jgi:hypothetical protein